MFDTLFREIHDLRFLEARDNNQATCSSTAFAPLSEVAILDPGIDKRRSRDIRMRRQTRIAVGRSRCCRLQAERLESLHRVDIGSLRILLDWLTSNEIIPSRFVGQG